MWRLRQKMKRISSTLRNWSKQEYGDIFATVKQYNDRVIIEEEEVLTDNIEENLVELHYINVEYI